MNSLSPSKCRDLRLVTAPLDSQEEHLFIYRHVDEKGRCDVLPAYFMDPTQYHHLSGILSHSRVILVDPDLFEPCMKSLSETGVPRVPDQAVKAKLSDDYDLATLWMFQRLVNSLIDANGHIDRKSYVSTLFRLAVAPPEDVRTILRLVVDCKTADWHPLSVAFAAAGFAGLTRPSPFLLLGNPLFLLPLGVHGQDADGVQAAIRNMGGEDTILEAIRGCVFSAPYMTACQEYAELDDQATALASRPPMSNDFRLRVLFFVAHLVMEMVSWLTMDPGVVERDGNSVMTKTVDDFHRLRGLSDPKAIESAVLANIACVMEVVLLIWFRVMGMSPVPRSLPVIAMRERIDAAGHKGCVALAKLIQSIREEG